MDTTWILYAGIATWLGIGLYLFILTQRQAVLAKRVAQLNELIRTTGE